MVAREVAGGDPLFVDLSREGLPVQTAKHGMGAWQPSSIAASWARFLAALECVRPYARGREHPVGLQENPLSPAERQALRAGLHDILGSPIASFWTVLLAPAESC